MLPPSFLTILLLLSPALASKPPTQPGGPVPPKVAPTKLENFTWSDPFSSPKLADFGSSCESERTFNAFEYQIHDLKEPEPKGLLPYRIAIKKLFTGRDYPGGWNGMDAHGYDRNILKMEYTDVPVKVREWIEEQERTEGPGKGLFGVYDKAKKGEMIKNMADLPEVDYLRPQDPQRIAVFTPGAIYETLPLWVAEGSDCEGTLTDLDKYSPKLVDGGVVGWTTNWTFPRRRWLERKMEFTVKAQVLSAKAKADTSGDAESQAAVKPDSKDEL